MQCNADYLLYYNKQPQGAGGQAWLGLAWPGLAWHGLAWHGSGWIDTLANAVRIGSSKVTNHLLPISLYHHIHP